jgi:hypothetical protein
MSAYRVRWRNGNHTVELDLLDPVGFLNPYKFFRC